jgi:hypothetical protein
VLPSTAIRPRSKHSRPAVVHLPRAETFRAYPSHETNVFVARNVSPLVGQLKPVGWSRS